MSSAGRSTVVEISAWLLDSSTVHLEVWQDSTQVRNLKITNPSAAEPGGAIAQAFSWSVLNRCLSNAGIAWWIISAISVTCAAVCVATAGFGCALCIAGLAGANVGLAVGCVERAARA